jgi:hypothetical protein
MKHMEWLTVPEVTLCKLNVAVEQCLSKALSVVANYDNCTRCRSERGVVWGSLRNLLFNLSAKRFFATTCAQGWIYTVCTAGSGGCALPQFLFECNYALAR